MTKIKPTMLRQGDVLLVPFECLPKDAPHKRIPATAVAVPRDKRGVVLAEGEMTGHYHGIRSRSATMYRSEDDVRFLRVGGGSATPLAHQEHTAVPVPPGDRVVVIHAEYVPGELPRQVAD